MQEKVYHIDEIFSRIKIAYNLKNERKAVAEFLGLPTTTLDNWKQRGSIGDWDTIFAKCNDLNFNWLLFGEGLPRLDSAEGLTPEEKLSAIKKIVR